MNKIKLFLKNLYNAPALSSLLRNAYCGWPNSQLELADFYLTETKNYIEAYAWAEVACCRNRPGALEIKKQAESLLSPLEIKEAWDLARKYKQSFIPN